MFGRRAAIGTPPVQSPPPAQPSFDGRGGASTKLAHSAPPPPPASEPKRSDDYYQTKGSIFGALIEAIDLSQLSKLDSDSAREEIRDIVNEIISIKNVVMSIAEQEDLLEDICNDVLGYGPLEPCWAATTSPISWSMGRRKTYIEVGGKIQLTNVPLPRQCAIDEYLPAHRQPDRPAGR